MPVPEPDILSYYTRPAVMTATGRYAPLLEPLPRDIAGLAAVGQGLIVHEHMAQEGYGVTLTEADRASVHTRPVEQILAQIVARDDRPLDIAREPAGPAARQLPALHRADDRAAPGPGHAGQGPLRVRRVLRRRHVRGPLDLRVLERGPGALGAGRRADRREAARAGSRSTST